MGIKITKVDTKTKQSSSQTNKNKNLDVIDIDYVVLSILIKLIQKMQRFV